ncbi:hypothetical protein J4440_02245 [Candidatus Woesearchaeota archaeon]|nr:hypothetical protein [Candidatus Woesearchaeota archaeon]
MEDILKSIGLSEREIKVYLALLELGQTTVGPVATKTRIQHPKIYQTLEKLIDKGLVSFIIISKTKHFQAQDPKYILNIIKEKERKFIEILPILKQKQKFSKDKQTATIYEGYESIKSMFNNIIENLTKNSYYYVFAFKEEYINSQLASRFLRNIHIRLSEKKLDDRLIVHSSIKKEFIKNYSHIKGIKYKFSNINIPFGLIITDNKIINWVWEERPTAVEITSKKIAGQYKLFFLDIWNSINKQQYQKYIKKSNH